MVLARLKNVLVPGCVNWRNTHRIVIISGMTFVGSIYVTEFSVLLHCAYNQVKSEIVNDVRWLHSSSKIFRRPHQDHGLLVRCILYLWKTAVWTTKIMIRIAVLWVVFVPLLLLHPFGYLSSTAHELWWRLAVWLCQRSGPTLIKLGQWASTRRDLFSKEFCDKMSVLHTKTTHRQWHLFRPALDELFGGLDWHSFLFVPHTDPIGSGCIAQVYRGVINVRLFEEVTGIRLPFAKSNSMDVAIKVAKSGVCERIAIDLAILRGAARLAQLVIPGLSYINPVSCLDQFQSLLELQVDLRNEAEALKRFARNFDAVENGVQFPSVICYSKDVIIETYEAGMNVNKLVTGECKVEHLVSAKKKVALLGARTLLKMIFVDNFVHGDLHPGNILVRFSDSKRRNVMQSFVSFRRYVHKLIDCIKGLLKISEDIRIVTSSQEMDRIVEPTLVILDTGIAIEEADSNLQKLRLLFRAVIDKQGREVGRLLLVHSPHSNCKEPDKFCTDVDRIVQIATSKSSLRRLDISEMLNELFSIVRKHEVHLEPSFTAVVLAVMVLEGLGRSLDPDLDLFQCARPFLFSMI